MTSMDDIRHLLNCDITKSEFAILCALLAIRGCDDLCCPSQTTIANATNMSRATVNRVMAKMYQRRWIVKETGPYKTPNIIINIKILPVSKCYTCLKTRHLEIDEVSQNVTHLSQIETPKPQIEPLPVSKRDTCNIALHNSVSKYIYKDQIAKQQHSG